MPGILDGVRIVDFTHMIAGPLSTMLLADFGADVIKVEPPEGETSRFLGNTSIGGQTDYFLALNRNKRSIVLDLKTPQGIETAKALVATADIVVENFRGGTADRMGIGYATLSAINPGLIYCSVSGFADPNDKRPALDPIVQPLSGIMQLTGDANSGPLKTGFPLGDYVAPLFATIGMLAALIERAKSGVGQKIDIAMLDVSVFSMIPRETAYFISGKQPGRFGNAHFQIVPAGTYTTSDDRQIMIFAHTEKFWRILSETMGDEVLISDPRFDTNAKRVLLRAEVEQRLADRFASQTKDHWLERLSEAGMPHAPVRSFDEVFADPSIRKNMIATVRHPTAGELRVLRTPIRMSRSTLDVTSPPPLLGEDTEQVLAELHRAAAE